MKVRFDPEKHHRHSIRLQGFDYTQPGGYFVTICTYERRNLFGRVVDGRMQLNRYGEIVREEWFRTAEIRPYVVLRADEFVVMPNHVHGIIWIVRDESEDPAGAIGPIAPAGGNVRPRGPAPHSLGAIVGQFKSVVSRRINLLRGTPGGPVWQRNYWERVVRSWHSLERIRRYIAENPVRWELDRENRG